MDCALKELLAGVRDQELLRQEATLLELLEYFFARYAGLPKKISHKTNEMRAIETCKEYLNENLDKNVSLSELSRIARIDRFLLVRCFTKIVGMPPHAWHKQKRIWKSLRLLSLGESVADVAVATGFFAFLVVAAVVAAFAFYFGRDRIVPLVASLYASIPLFIFFPYDTTPYGGVIVTLALWLGFVLIGMIVFSGLAAFVASGSIGFIKLIVLSAATAGLVLALAVNVLPAQEIYTFSIPTLALFNTPEMFFLWLSAPLVGIFFFGRG